MIWMDIYAPMMPSFGSCAIRRMESRYVSGGPRKINGGGYDQENRKETGVAAIGDPSGMFLKLQEIATVHIGPRRPVWPSFEREMVVWEEARVCEPR
jgi:hypothetical protein